MSAKKKRKADTATQTFDNVTSIIKTLSSTQLDELKEEIDRWETYRRQFATFNTCSNRWEAMEEASDPKFARFVTTDCGSEYGYWSFKKFHEETLSFVDIPYDELTDDQQDEWLEYQECCYSNGQACFMNKSEFCKATYNGDPCDCEMGKEMDGSHVHELDEAEEKRYGVYRTKDERYWKISKEQYYKPDAEDKFEDCGIDTAQGDDNYDKFYSLQEVKRYFMQNYCRHNKKDDVDECVHCNRVMAWDGNTDLVLEGAYRDCYNKHDTTEETAVIVVSL